MSKITGKQLLPFIVLVAIAIASIFIPSFSLYDDQGKYNTADIAWLIVATALVFIMTPGLAFFYGGMVHRKNVLSTMIKSMFVAGIISILWVVVGYSLWFCNDFGGIGFLEIQIHHIFMRGDKSGECWFLVDAI